MKHQKLPPSAFDPSKDLSVGGENPLSHEDNFGSKH
jgi:hypothetical protein